MRSIILIALACAAHAYNNGVARKPPLGWQTWCSAGPCGTDHCFDYQIKDTAKAMVDNGMKAAGYEWIILDDCWHPRRDSNGTLVPHAAFFPDGMMPVIDYVHSLGLKFGLYTSVGTTTCHGGWSPGSLGHFEEDANLFAGWGVDYVKIDYCGKDDSPEGHKNFSRALNATGRPIVLELCRGPYQEQADWGYAPSIAQVWRATGDHHDRFSSTIEQVEAMSRPSIYIPGEGGSGPYGWAYGDMMMTGGEGCVGYDPKVPQHCPKQTDAEYRTEVSLYSVLGSPMMVGTDIRNMTAIMTQLLLDPTMLRINQDEEARIGEKISTCGGTDAWVRHLTGGDVAIALPNLGDDAATLKVCAADVGISAAAVTAMEVWTRKSLTPSAAGDYSLTVASHDTALLYLSPRDEAAA